MHLTRLKAHKPMPFAVLLFTNLVVAQVVVTPSEPPLRSQAAHLQILRNLGRLNVELGLDRSEYFPSEDAEVTVRISNPSGSVEVFDPLDGTIVDVSLYRHDSSGWHRVYLDERDSGIRINAPSIWLTPGQVLTSKFLTSDPARRNTINAAGKRGISICRECVTPELEGEYEYRFLGARAGFSVVWPQFEQWTQVRFQTDGTHVEPARGNTPGKVFTGIPRFILFAVLGYQKSHIIVVSVTTTAPRLSVDPSGKFTGDVSRSFGVLRRIATSSLPITSLQATADPAENIVVIYSDQSGRSYRLKLNANRDLVP